MASILFVPRSTFSYVSMKFAFSWDIGCEYLDTPMYISTPIEVFVCTDKVYHVSSIMFMGFKTLAYLVVLYMEEFDVILGLIWLSPSHTFLNYFA